MNNNYIEYLKREVERTGYVSFGVTTIDGNLCYENASVEDSRSELGIALLENDGYVEYDDGTAYEIYEEEEF